MTVLPAGLLSRSSHHIHNLLIFLAAICTRLQAVTQMQHSVDTCAEVFRLLRHTWENSSPMAAYAGLC